MDKERIQTSRKALDLRVAELIETARQKVAGIANVTLVYTYYEIGRMIVEEEQEGKVRAAYGRKLLTDLSAKLTERFGKGWSVDNLERMRSFFILYSPVGISATTLRKTDERGNPQEIRNSVAEIRQAEGDNLKISPVLFAKSVDKESINHTGDFKQMPFTMNEISSAAPRFVLSWSHYLVLMRIADPAERAFYEHEAAEGQWSLRHLSRQIGSQLYERSLKHAGKSDVKKLMRKAPRPDVVEEPLKNPYMLEFLGLPEKTDYTETQLEQAIIDHIQEFMLELGKGFTFVGRQVRFTFDEEHYTVDLVFYNRLTRSFFVFDLKLSKITHQDLGQMQMYVHYYDRVVKLPDENPTIGILLSSEEVNDATVKLTLPESEHDRIFARQYKTVLPSAATFQRIIRQQRIAFENRTIAAPVRKQELE